MMAIKLYPGYENWSELELLTGAIIGEARNQCRAGREAVGITIRNRVIGPWPWWGRNWREVILQDRQFSCWADRNASVIISEYNRKTPLWTENFKIAADIYLDKIIDSIGGPTHYHSKTIKPYWISDCVFLKQIGDHLFYRLKHREEQ